MKNKKVFDLMEEYFINRKKRSEIRKERIMFWETNKCANGDCIKGTAGNEMNPETNELYDIIPKEVKDYCDTCKKRHEFYLSLKKIQNRNAAIMNIVRNLVKTIN